MSHILRLLRTSRSSNPLHTLRSSRPIHSKTTNYFSPSHAPFPRPPPTRLSRRFHTSFDALAANQKANCNVLYSLMGVNVAVFGYAMYAKAQAQSGFPQLLLKHMHNWTLNYTHVIHNGMYWTLLTSAFSHIQIWHLTANMLTTYYLGQFLCSAAIITPARLLTIAIGSGVTGSLGFLYQRYLVTGGKGVDYASGLGFSGVVMGITSVAACLTPTAKVAIYGIIPVPLWGVVLGYAVYDGYYLNTNDRTAHAGHLGGLVFGIAYYLLKLRGL
ncbi:hypothetical protein BDU57DRAFT_508929 [Ampelomyces quisqualis]|uniref:Peptidase S54 rhomboid domain-containing protein n=1 Tax=Ampelomyces quisqualis TaxID=50730 RepID=A0A6A5QZ75_AMPQU|nr:hypothetical protein BDU57DRAFT_508929 [Ampelomyces quisqualis]